MTKSAIPAAVPPMQWDEPELVSFDPSKEHGWLVLKAPPMREMRLMSSDGTLLEIIRCTCADPEQRFEPTCPLHKLLTGPAPNPGDTDDR